MAEPSAFGDLLRQHRVESGWTQEELAERAGVSVRALSDLERGVIRQPRFYTVGQLADAFDLSGDERSAFAAAARLPPPFDQQVAGNAPSPDEGLTTHVLTFLFTDARGYTRFTLEQGDEAAARFAAELARVVDVGVQARGGSVVETQGDAVLAVFGSVRQALRCALDLQERFARELESNPTLPFKMGIGLDAGEAVPVEGGYRGGALNLASRLCALAGPDETLASGTVVSLAGKLEGLEYLERGMVQLKGLIEPVRVVQVRESAVASQSAAAQVEVSSVLPVPPGDERERPPEQHFPLGGFLGSLPSGTLVARETELASIVSTVDEVAEGKGRLVLLTGEPGSGKTRLAQEVSLVVRNRDFLIGAGNCYEPQQTVPYYPFLDTLSMLYGAAPASVRNLVTARWPYLGRLLPESPISTFQALPDSNEEQQRLFRAVTSFIQAVSEVIPVALFLDDLHWADSASLDLLEHLARHTRAHRVFLLGTYRNIDVRRRRALEQFLLDLHREQLVERLTVRRLKPSGTAALIAAFLGESDVSEQLSSFVHDRTEGNPFFTQEVVRSLVERGHLYKEDGVWQRGSITEIEVPESVRSVIWHRLSRLSEPTQEILSQASVLGQTFVFADLEAMGARAEDQVEQALDEAWKSDLIYEVERDRYRFNHALTQQTLYDEIPVRRRRRLHLAAGQMLEQLPERARQHAAELTWHFQESGRPERALPYALSAGDQAVNVSAYGEAEGHYRTALELARDLEDQAQQARSLENLGTVFATTGRVDQSMATLEEAAAIYHELADLESEARVVAEMGQRAYERGTADETIGRVKTMLELMEPRGPSIALGNLYLAQVYYLLHKMHHEETLGPAERALDVARAVEDDKLLVAALYRAGAAKAEFGPREEGILLLEEAVATAERTGDLYSRFWVEMVLGQLHWTYGEIEVAAPCFERGYEIAEQMENQSNMAYTRAMLGAMLFYQGKWDRARREYDRALEMVPAAGHSWGSWVALTFLGLFCVAEGSWEEAERHLGEALAMAQESDSVEWRLNVLETLGELELLRGRPRQALRHLESLGRNLEPGIAPSAQGFALLEAGDVAGAAAAGSRGLQYATKRRYRVLRPEAQELCGSVAAIQGQWEAAEGHFQDGLSQARAMGLPYFEARLLFRRALMHERRPEHEQARTDLEAALTIFREIGARPYVARSERALAALYQP